VNLFNKLQLMAVAYLLILAPMLLGISGRIVSEEGLGIEGASVTDGHRLVYSSVEGFFSIESRADSLRISRIGYQPKVVARSELDQPVVLKEQSLSVERVWVRAEYRDREPVLGATLIHTDTNAGMRSAGDLVLESSSFFSTDTRLAGERQTASLLGSFSRHSLVLLDGVAQNAAGEEFDFSKISVEQIDRIEVIKGNASAYGGSAAIGGIIHIHTKAAMKQAELEASVLMEAGSFDYYKQLYRTYLRRGNLAAILEYTHQDAFNDFYYDTPDFWGLPEPLRRLHNRKQSDGIYAKATYLYKAVQMDYSFNLGSFTKELPGPINFPDLYDRSRLIGRYQQHNLRGTLAGKSWTHELSGWNYLDYSLYRNLESTNQMARSHYSQNQANRGIQAASSLLLGDTKLSALAELKELNFSFLNRVSESSVEGERINKAMALRIGQSLYPWLMRWKTALALRVDWSEDEFHPSWRFEHELELPWSEELLLGGYLGESFSQPSLFDMYWIGDSETHGNPDLKSENSIGYNFYLSWMLSGIRIRGAYYHNRVENLIQWRQYYLNGMSWKPFNVGTAVIDNYELDTSWKRGLILVGAAVTGTNAKDLSLEADGSPSVTYGKRLVYTPDLRINLSIKAGNENRGLSLKYSYTGEQYSTVDNLIESLPAFDSLDAEAYYGVRLGRIGILANLKLMNILDKRYEIYAYTPQPGRNWTASLRLTYSSPIAGSKPVEQDLF
jgi:outer membrane cobalamin receptor